MSNTTTVSADPYWSRHEGRWEAAPREDPVVWGETAGPLSAAQLEEFQRDGYAFAPQRIGSHEVQRLLVEAQAMAADADPRGSGVVIEPDSRAVRSLFRIHRTEGPLGAICRDRRLVAPARQILGSDVYIHQSRINFKPAFDGKEFFWHSDFETWHMEDGMPRMRAVSVSLSLTESTEFNGPLIVVPGSHHHYIRCQGMTPENHFQQSLRRQEYGVPGREALQMLVDSGGMIAPKGPAGSTLMFDCNLMHGSSGNLSPQPRINLFVVFNSVVNTLREPFGRQPRRPEFLAERDVTPLPG